MKKIFFILCLFFNTVYAIDYPTALDSFGTVQDGVDTVSASDINNLRRSSEALQTKVGITNSNVTTSIDYKVRLLDWQRVTDQRRYVTPPKVLHWEAFDRDDQWAFTAATNWTKEVDATNVKAGGQYSSAAFGKLQGLKLTAPGESSQTVTITRTYPATVDMSATGAILVLRYYLHPGEDAAVAEGFNSGGYVYLYDASGNYYRYQYQPASLKNHAGWNTWSVAIANWGAKSANAPNLAAISKINVNVQAANSATCAITYDLLAVTEKPPFAYLLISDDDWMINANLLVTALNSRVLNDRVRYPSGHLVGTFYICPGLLNYPGYSTIAQMKAAYAEGHAICPHIWDDTESGWGAWHVLTMTQKRLQIDAMKQWLVDNGMPGGERCLATSVGHIRWSEELALIEEGRLDQVRSAAPQYVGAQFKADGGLSHNFDSLFDPRIIHTSVTISGLTDADLVYGVNKLAEVGGLMCVYHHNGALAAMTGFLDRAAVLANAGSIEVVTAPELAALTEARRYSQTWKHPDYQPTGTSGSFVDAAGATVTVENGLITAITPAE